MTKKSGSFFSNFDPNLIGPWPARIGWFAMPLVFRAGFIPATSGLDPAGALGLELFAWMLWFVGLVAVAVNHPIALTVIRMVAPIVPVAMLTVMLLLSAAPAPVLLVFGYGAVLTLAVLLPSFGDSMVNGSAYGPERRFALSAPGFALFGSVPIVWISVYGLLATGAILSATKYPRVGLPVLFLGAALTYSGVQALHQLSRRWLVFVPAGFVIHDHVLLTEPVLIPRKVIENMGLVETNTNSGLIPKSEDLEIVDVTGGASGLVIQVETSADIPLTLKGRAATREINTRTLRISATLPGKVLTEARARGIRVGATTRTSSKPTVA